MNEPYEVNVARQDQDTPWRAIKLVRSGWGRAGGGESPCSTDMAVWLILCCRSMPVGAMLARVSSPGEAREKKAKAAWGGGGRGGIHVCVLAYASL